MNDRRDLEPGRTPGGKPARRRKRTYLVRPLPPRGEARGEATGTVASTRGERVEPGPPPRRRITPEQRRQWIAEAAYYRAERRGFVGGDPAEDWRAAEAEIDARLLGIGTEADG